MVLTHMAFLYVYGTRLNSVIFTGYFVSSVEPKMELRYRHPQYPFASKRLKIS